MQRQTPPALRPEWRRPRRRRRSAPDRRSIGGAQVWEGRRFGKGAKVALPYGKAPPLSSVAKVWGKRHSSSVAQVWESAKVALLSVAQVWERAKVALHPQSHVGAGVYSLH